MAYVALYRTWRPQTFDDLVGQQPIKTALTNALASGRISHAYLFAGPRGTGKTSTARILAKALNCEHGPTAHPCGTCTNCQEITQGTSADVIEIDAASNRGIDEIRKLREQVYFAPVSSRYKVYIIDEVHMITTDAFNALLKTLEEPPEHVIFILATTDPQKILPTILSRCQRYDFHRATVQEIAEHLTKVAAGSQIQAEPEALQLMAIQADGGLRDALSLLDQCSVMASPVTTATVRQVLGIVGREKLRLLVEQLGKKDLSGALDTLSDLLAQGKEMEQILVELLSYFRALLLFKADREYQEIYLTDTAEALETLAGLFTQARIIASAERIHKAIQDCRYSLRKKIVGELCLFDLCESRDDSTAALEARIEELEQQVKDLQAGGTPAPTAWTMPAQQAPQMAPQPAYEPAPPATPVAVAPAFTAPAPRASQRPAFTPPEPPKAPKTAQPMPWERRAATPQFGERRAADSFVYVTPQGQEQGRKLWNGVIQSMGRSGKKVYHIYAERAHGVMYDGAELVISVDNKFSKERLEASDLHNLILSALSSLTGRAISLTILLNEEEKRRVKQAPAGKSVKPAEPEQPKVRVPVEPEPDFGPMAEPSEDDIPLPEPSDEEYALAGGEEPTELPDTVKKAMQVFGGRAEKIAKSEK